VLAHAEHEKIFELAIARDADAAVEALSIHIWSAVEFLKGSGLILESPDKEG
jgi:DNA-binding GntR family transcriptional regulator